MEEGDLVSTQETLPTIRDEPVRTAVPKIRDDRSKQPGGKRRQDGAHPRPLEPRQHQPALRVLLIEDEPPVAWSLKRQLEAEGIHADIAADGETGLAMAGRQPYDAILIDRRLPKMSGDRVLEQLRGDGDQTPVLILTGYPNVDSAFRAGRLRAAEYLQKGTLTATQLADAVRRAAATCPRAANALPIDPRRAYPRAGFPLVARQPSDHDAILAGVEMATAGSPTRTHQVKVSLLQADAMEIASFARQEGAGSGTLVRRLALKHVTALQKPGAATLPTPAGEGDKVKLGHHISVWFTEKEHALLHYLSTTAGMTISGYLGRCVLEPWLRLRRNALAKALTTAQSLRKP